MKRDDDYQVNSESRHKIAFVSFLGLILIKFFYINGIEMNTFLSCF